MGNVIASHRFNPGSIPAEGQVFSHDILIFHSILLKYSYWYLLLYFIIIIQYDNNEWFFLTLNQSDWVVTMYFDWQPDTHNGFNLLLSLWIDKRNTQKHKQTTEKKNDYYASKDNIRAFQKSTTAAQ